MRLVSKCFALLALSRLALPLYAAGAHEVGFGVTPADDEYNELRQSVALLADGSFATVWNTAGDARLQILRPDGSKVFPDDGRGVTDSPLPFSNIVVTANPAGGAFVAFSGGSPGGMQVFVQSFDADGNPRWETGGAFAATPAFGDDQIQTQLVAAPQGGVYVCLHSFHKIGGRGDEIVCQRLSAGGQRLWTDQGVSANGGADGNFREVPKVVRDGRNGLMVFWRDNHMGLLTPNEHVEIKGQHLAPDGTRSWGAQGRTVRTTRLLAGAGGGYNSLDAVPDGQGGAVVSFNDGTSVNDLDVFAQRITGDGRLLWRNGVAVATGSSYQANDSLTATRDGGAFVTVRQPVDLGDELWLYRLAPNGKALWKQQVTSGDPRFSFSDFGAYTSFDNGRLRLAWGHYRSDGRSFDVYLAVYDLAGHRLNGADGTPLTSAQHAQFLRGFAFDPARKQGLAVWDDQRKDNAADFDTRGALYQE
jgi:hypothetical protein